MSGENFLFKESLDEAAMAALYQEAEFGDWKVVVKGNTMRFWQRYEGKWSITPGGYYIETLLESQSNYFNGLCIDGGSGWTVPGEVMGRVLEYLADARAAQMAQMVWDYSEAEVFIAKGGRPLVDAPPQYRLEINRSVEMLFQGKVLLKRGGDREMAQTYATAHGARIYYATRSAGTTFGTADPEAILAN